MPCPNSARDKRTTISFRCTPEQAANIDRLVAMSGMPKQDYIMAKLTDCEIHATPNTRLYKGLGDAAKSICLELRRIHAADELDERTVAVMETLTSILKDLGAFDAHEVSQAQAEGAHMLNMSRE